MDKVTEREDEIREILKKYIAEEEIRLLGATIHTIAELEPRLNELLTHPFIKYHPTDPRRSKATTESRMFKELKGMYDQSIKMLAMFIRHGNGSDEDELDNFIKDLGIGDGV